MRIKRKLQSQRGASITFALLLFLVCAVVGSVVLAAGSAAAGRMAGLPRSDQRYYSVTSAARLFEDLFEDNDGKNKITVKRTDTYIKTETTEITGTDGSYQYGETNLIPPATHTYTCQFLDASDEPFFSPQNLFQKLTCELVLGSAELMNPTEAEWSAAFPMNLAKKTVSLTVGDKKDLAVDIEIQPATFTPGGSAQLVMDFKNHVDSAADTKTPQFKLRMTWIADADKPPVTTDEAGNNKEVASVEETDKVTSYSENAIIVTSNVKETKTTSVTWHVVSLEVIGGGAGS
jgi:hypothetical protein